jgi:hypothetical protein
MGDHEQKSRDFLKTYLIQPAVLFIVIMSAVSTAFAVDKNEPISQPALPLVQAMGGAFTAVATDESTVFYNPAGYATITDPILTVSVVDISFNVNDSALAVYRAIIDGEDLSDPGNIDKYLSNTTLSYGISGPIYLGHVGNNFGFSFYNVASSLLDTTPGALQPTADFLTFTDLGFTGGFGYNVVDHLYVGFNVKVILRLKSQLDGTVTEVIDTIEDDDVPIAKSVAFGGDLGLLYRPKPWLSLGLNARDFFGTRFAYWEDISGNQNYPSSMIKPRLAIGVAFFPIRKNYEEIPKNDLTVALDYWDLLDNSSPLSNIKLGLMFRTLKVLDLRAGLDAGYLTGGIGVHLKFFHFSTSYYVKELGAYPGSNPLQTLSFEFAFKW